MNTIIIDNDGISNSKFSESENEDKDIMTNYILI